MAHLLHRFGAAALQQRSVGDKLLPPLLSFSQAMKLREQFYAHGQQWPYENIVPGPPRPPPGAQQYLDRMKAKELKKEARLKEIQDAMAKMPQLIAEYKAARRVDWAEVSVLDKLTLTRGQIKDKYVKKRLSKQ